MSSSKNIFSELTPADIAIVGMGTAGLATFIQLVKKEIKKGKPKLNITLLEKNPIAGPGRPWYPIQILDFEVNDSNWGMIIDPDNPNDFINWIKENADLLKKTFPKEIARIDALAREEYRFAPRAFFGIYCNQRLHEYIELAKSNGIKVALELETEITEAKPDTPKGWQLKSKNEKVFHAKKIVVSAGHISSNKFPHLKKLKEKDKSVSYYSTPYKQDFSQISPDNNIAIVGSALTAIDAARRLKAQGHKGKITFVSPSATIVSVKGPKTDISYKLQHLTAENLSKPGMRLTDILELFKMEYDNTVKLHNQAFPNEPAEYHINSAEELLAFARNARKKDPSTSLDKEMKWSIEGKKVRYWQLMLLEAFFGALMPICRALKDNDADFKKYLDDYFPLYTKWMTATTPNTAKDLQELFRSGQLEVVPATPDIQYDSKSHKFHIDLGNGKTMTADTVVNATGTSHDTSLLSLKIPIDEDKFGGFRTTPDHRAYTNGRERHDCYVLGACSGPKNLAGLSIEHNSIVAAEIVRDMNLDSRSRL